MTRLNGLLFIHLPVKCRHKEENIVDAAWSAMRALLIVLTAGCILAFVPVDAHAYTCYLTDDTLFGRPWYCATETECHLTFCPDCPVIYYGPGTAPYAGTMGPGSTTCSFGKYQDFCSKNPCECDPSLCTCTVGAGN